MQKFRLNFRRECGKLNLNYTDRHIWKFRQNFNWKLYGKELNLQKIYLLKLFKINSTLVEFQGNSLPELRNVDAANATQITLIA